MLKIKKTTETEIKNAFHRLISTWNIAEKRMSELVDISIECLKTKKTKRTKTENNSTESPQTVGQPQKV